MAERLVWSPNIAWVRTEDSIAVALLPDGPINLLTGADALLEHMDGRFTVEELIGRAVEVQPEQAEPLRVGVREFINSLKNRGILVAQTAPDP